MTGLSHGSGSKCQEGDSSREGIEVKTSSPPMRQIMAVRRRRVAGLVSPDARPTNLTKEAFTKLLIEKYKIRHRNSKQSKEPAAYFISPESGPEDTARGAIRTATADRNGEAQVARRVPPFDGTTTNGHSS